MKDKILDVIDENGNFIVRQISVLVKTKYSTGFNNFYIKKEDFNDETYKDLIKKDIEKYIKPGKYEIIKMELIPESEMVPF